MFKTSQWVEAKADVPKSDFFKETPPAINTKSELGQKRTPKRDKE